MFVKIEQIVTWESLNYRFEQDKTRMVKDMGDLVWKGEVGSVLE